MFSHRTPRRSLTDAVPGLGTAAPLAPGLWSRPFMEPVRFRLGESTLDERAEEQLDELAVALSWFATSANIELAGHTWDEGNDERSRQLGQQRAEAVRTALIDRGLPPWVLKVRGYGAERPVPAGQGVDPVEGSRRVELWLHQRTVDTPLPCNDPGASDCCRGC